MGRSAVGIAAYGGCVVRHVQPRAFVSLGRRIEAERLRRGSYVADIAEVDLDCLLRVSSSDARCMDPQHRALLSTSVVPAGMLVAEGLGGGCCVTVGFGDKEWGEVLSSQPPLTGGAPVTSTGGAVASGRISFLHGMPGPCYALDTVCSSTLCAWHVASRSVCARESASALSMSVCISLRAAISQPRARR